MMVERMDTLISLEQVLLFVRIALGAVMVYYGWPKVRNLRTNAGQFAGMGFRPGWLFGTPVAIIEFFGGLLMIVGVATGLIAAAFGFQMLLGALWKVRAGKDFPDWSYDVLALAAALAVMVGGGGTYSLACTQTWFLRWDVVLAAIVLAFIGAVVSRPRKQA